MAVSVRPPSESNKGKLNRSAGGVSNLNQGPCQKLQEMFKNDMINTKVLPKIKVDT